MLLSVAHCVSCLAIHLHRTRGHVPTGSRDWLPGMQHSHSMLRQLGNLARRQSAGHPIASNPGPMRLPEMLRKGTRDYAPRERLARRLHCCGPARHPCRPQASASVRLGCRLCRLLLFGALAAPAQAPEPPAATGRCLGWQRSCILPPVWLPAQGRVPACALTLPCTWRSLPRLLRNVLPPIVAAAAVPACPQPAAWAELSRL